MDESESYSERRERIRALPDWVAPALDMNNWGNRHFKPTEETGVRYRFHISKDCVRLERWRASWGWQPLRGWTIESDGTLRHYTGITEATLDVCEHMVNDWVRVSNQLFADCEYPEECENPDAGVTTTDSAGGPITPPASAAPEVIETEPHRSWWRYKFDGDTDTLTIQTPHSVCADMNIQLSALFRVAGVSSDAIRRALDIRVHEEEFELISHLPAWVRPNGPLHNPNTIVLAPASGIALSMDWDDVARVLRVSINASARTWERIQVLEVMLKVRPDITGKKPEYVLLAEAVVELWNQAASLFSPTK